MVETYESVFKLFPSYAVYKDWYLPIPISETQVCVFRYYMLPALRLSSVPLDYIRVGCIYTNSGQVVSLGRLQLEQYTEFETYIYMY